MLNQIKTEGNQSLSILGRKLSAFHAEEQGASGSIDNVMMVFVAALILVGLVTLVNENVWNSLRDKVQELFQATIG